MYTGFLSDAISRELSTPIALACVLCEPEPVDRLIVPEQAQQHSGHDLGSWAENLRASEKNLVDSFVLVVARVRLSESVWRIGLPNVHAASGGSDEKLDVDGQIDWYFERSGGYAMRLTLRGGGGPANPLVVHDCGGPATTSR